MIHLCSPTNRHVHIPTRLRLSDGGVYPRGCVASIVPGCLDGLCISCGPRVMLGSGCVLASALEATSFLP